MQRTHSDIFRHPSTLVALVNGVRLEHHLLRRASAHDGKKWKVHGLEKALESVPEEQRASVAEEIAKELSNFDPGDQPGEAVAPVAPGTRTCPSCSGTLVELGFIPNSERNSVCILECETCDATFCESLAAPLQ